MTLAQIIFVWMYFKKNSYFPPARSFSINGLSLTNAKTSFAAGFGLQHWSILEGGAYCLILRAFDVHNHFKNLSYK